MTAVYAVLLFRGFGEGEARMMSFACMVIANLGLILANRSATQPIRAILRKPNRAMWWVAGGACAVRGVRSGGPKGRTGRRHS